MAPKRTTTKRAAPRRPKRSQAPAALFIETSAHILRITGSRELQRGINELVDAAGKLGTSWFVKREFEKVLIRFYRAVAEATSMLTNRERPRPFEEMWQEVKPLLPLFYPPGGPNLYPHLDAKMYAMFGGQDVTPAELQSSFKGYEEAAWESFLSVEGEIHDKSSCEVWITKGSCPCSPEPEAHCQLKELCVKQNTDFLKAASTIAEGKFAESRWMAANLPRLRNTRGKALLEFIGKHPNPVGDIVIFWEVPDGWTLLTRDRAFKALRKAHRKKLKVYTVRLPRLDSGGQCGVRLETNGAGVGGVLLNYNAKGALINASLAGVKKGARVVVTADEFGHERRGEVAYPPKKDKSVFAVKLPYDTKRV
ncbi:MAG: hypothetical protein QOJ70_2486 [Acidobacteriota bacterium]|nr:hypothetical protein [Acidobacteriota bacterium]